MAARLDHSGRMAWLGLMVVGFVFCWPIGLAVLAYLTWSGRMGGGRMGCWNMESANRWQQKLMEHRREHHRRRERWGHWSSGNRAFDEYRTETLRRLEEEEQEFREFLDRLRFAKDKAEFDAFLAQRQDQPRPTPTEEV